MRDAVTDAKVGRRAVLRIAGVDGTGAITEIEVVDPGFGYEYDYSVGADNNLTFRLVSANGSGGSLKVVIDTNGSLILADDGGLEDGNYTLVGGQDYTLSDLLIAPAPFLYEVDEPIILKARVNDPLGEVSRVAFYGNGVELSGSLNTLMTRLT